MSVRITFFGNIIVVTTHFVIKFLFFLDLSRGRWDDED